MSTDFQFAQNTRLPIPTPRGPFVPPWYEPHPDETLAVCDENGTPLGFTVGDVAPERRWVIGTDGRVMGIEEFHPMYRLWLEGQWQWQNPPERPQDVTFGWFPQPVTFVAKRVDPANPNRVCEITIRRPRQRKAGPRSDERPVDAAALAASPGWAPAPKKDTAEPDVAPDPTPVGKAILSCDDCGTTAKSPAGLAAHRRHKHPPEKEA
jgi:hypothetical protein